MDYDEFESRHRAREERRRERSRRRAHRRERRHRHHGDERKEKVLHTRISEHLADDIRKVAEELRVPVSNLVRNVLEEAFSVVETVSENVGELLEEVLDEAELARRRYRTRGRRRERFLEDEGDAEERGEGGEDVADTVETGPEAAAAARPRPEFAEVLGWQPLLLNREQACADCGATVERGERAFVGVTSTGLSSTILCRTCTEERA